MNRIPAIKSVMTPFPHFVEPLKNAGYHVQAHFLKDEVIRDIRDIGQRPGDMMHETGTEGGCLVAVVREAIGLQVGTAVCVGSFVIARGFGEARGDPAG